MGKDFTYKELCDRLAKGLNFKENAAVLITHLDGEDLTNCVYHGKRGIIVSAIDDLLRDILSDCDDHDAQIVRYGIKQALIDDEEQRFQKPDIRDKPSAADLPPAEDAEAYLAEKRLQRGDGDDDKA